MKISGEVSENLSESLRRVFPSEKSLPFTTYGQQQFREASRAGDLKDRLIGEGMLLTGLSLNTFAHMRPDWLETENEQLFINVPGGQMPCTLSPGKSGKTRTSGRQPCRNCKTNGDGEWSINETLMPRRIPVPEPELADFIKKYFKVYDRVATPSTLEYHLEKLGEEAGFEARISSMNLRMTFGKLLAEKGFDGETIQYIMGHPNTRRAKTMVQRYFVMSENHSFPPYHCNANRSRNRGSCSRTVVFPTKACHSHS